MNPNNFFPLDAFRFINIIDGTDSYYSTPQRAVPLMNQNRHNEALKASGLPPECTVYIPTLDLRTTGWKEQTIYQYPEENRPNPNEPYIYKISTPIFWNRGMNTSTGEGPKAELTCGIDLLNCEFNGSFRSCLS